jgi:hypothetical protein
MKRKSESRRNGITIDPSSIVYFENSEGVALDFYAGIHFIKRTISGVYKTNSICKRIS